MIRVPSISGPRPRLMILASIMASSLIIGKPLTLPILRPRRRRREGALGSRRITLLRPRRRVGRLALREQVVEQAVEVVLGDLVGEVGRHRRERRGLALGDGRLGDADLLALRVGQDEDLALLAEQQARDDLAVLQRQGGDAERLVDVAVRVEDVLDEAVEPAAADAVELRPDPRALAAELVADAAVLLEDRGALLRADASRDDARNSARRRSIIAASFWSAGGSPASNALSRSASRGGFACLSATATGCSWSSRAEAFPAAMASSSASAPSRRRASPAAIAAWSRPGATGIASTRMRSAPGRPLAASRPAAVSRSSIAAAGSSSTSFTIASLPAGSIAIIAVSAADRCGVAAADRPATSRSFPWTSGSRSPLASSIPRSISPASVEPRSARACSTASPCIIAPGGMPRSWIPWWIALTSCA